MKNYRFGILMILLMLSVQILVAQNYKVAAPSGKDGKLVLKNFSDDLPIEGYTGNTIEITSSEGQLNPPERAKGLKAIYPSGTDNTGVGVSVEKEGNNVIITCLIPFTKHSAYSFKVPDNLAVEIESGCENSTNISVTGMKNEIAIKTCHDVDLKNITGPVVISSISGDINVAFSQTVSDKPSSINAISGDVDLTIPAKSPLNVELSTINGGFFSDFEISQTEKELRRIGGNNIDFTLNGGGPKFSIVTVSGNVYLRKGM